MTSPTVVVDASVVLKWFHEEGEQDTEAARMLIEAHANGNAELVLLDLTLYEIGNALVRGVNVPPGAVATILDAVVEIAPPVALSPQERLLAAQLATQHGLTFYDAACAAIARSMSAALATHDRALIAAGLGRPPHSILAQLD